MKNIILPIVIFNCLLTVSYAQRPGDLDSSFGINGIAISAFGFETYFVSTALQNDGKIVAAGYTFNGSPNLIVARYNIDGSLDSTFSEDGLQVSNNFNSANSVAIQPDGKIVLAAPGGIIRYNTDGSLDNTLIQADQFDIDFLAIQSDGKIVAVGNDRTTYDPVLIRYNTDGGPDNSFSDDGKQFTDFGGSFDQVRTVAIQSDGKIVVGGSSDFDFAVARYNNDGTVDLSFSNDGKQTTDFGSSEDGTSLAMQADGKIVVGGNTYINDEYAFCLARYNVDGSLDNSFSNDGKQITDLPSYAYTVENSLAIQTNGKIIIGGNSSVLNNNLNQFTLIRYNADGSIDLTFSDDGIQTTDISEGSGLLYTLAIGSNKLYAVGFGQIPSHRGIIARYLLDENVIVSCPSSKMISTANGKCDATVNNIDPVLQSSGGQINYILSGATVANGTGSVSGKTFNKGVTKVTYTLANDASKNCSFTVTVRDKEPPSITNIVADPTSIWPPNHKMYAVTISYDVKDNCGFNAPVLSVSSDNGNSADWIVLDNHHVQLRAEKGNRGTERIYTITIGVTDLSGNKSAKAIDINVSKNKIKARSNTANRPAVMEEGNVQNLVVRATPNPSANYFTLFIKSNSDAPVNARVIDVLGRVVETKANIAANGILRIGNGYREGIYFIEVRQGAQRHLIKLNKQ